MAQVRASFSRRGERCGIRRFDQIQGSPQGKSRAGLRWSLCSLLLLSMALFASGTEFYVSPTGSASGDGSVSRPWNLATGLGQPASVRPGDTIWLRGGRYTFPAGGNVLIGLRGTATAPITVAQYPGERATLDIRGAAQGLFFTNSPNPAGAAYVNFKNFEITDSDTARSSRRPVAVYVRLSDSLKFINLVVHDTGIAFDLNVEATNTEVYGSVIYYCDDAGDPLGLAHGIYIQNTTGYKKAVDNIVFSNSGYGIHAYPHTEDGGLLNVSLLGNIAFNGGALGSYATAPDLLIGGSSVAVNPVVDNNKTYKPSGTGGWNQQIGYGAGCTTPSVTNNYFVGTTVFTACTSGLTLTGNTFYGGALTEPWGGPTTPISTSAFPSNTYSTVRPSGVKVFLQKNQYEAGRANIAVYNWDRQSSVDVSLSGVLGVGAVYEVRNAQNFYGAPVVAAVYDGGLVRIPLSALSAASPVGLLAPNPTGPDFNAFVVVTTSGSAPPNPTPSPSPSPSPTPTPTPTPVPQVTATPPPSPTASPSATPGPSVTPTPVPAGPTPVPTAAAPTPTVTAAPKVTHAPRQTRLLPRR